MNLFEYQGKKLFALKGIPVPEGSVVTSVDELPELVGGRVVKAQVLTGGRGKAGAVKVCSDPANVKKAVEEILSMKVKGHQVNSVLIEELIDIKEEYYFSISVNRKKKIISMMFTNKGGMEVESLATDEISTTDVNPMIGLKPYMIKELLLPFGLDGNDNLYELIEKSYELFTEEKLLLLEINPLAVTGDGKIIALDSKVTLDDNYLTDEFNFEGNVGGDLTPVEAEIASYGATGVELDGEIAVVAAGAGCSMATADSIVKRGGTVRLIFDIGTLPSDSSDEEDRKYSEGAYKAVVKLEPKVILFNYFYQAGHLGNEAMTIKNAVGDIADRIPIIFRCKGRKSEEAMEYLKDAGFYLTDSYDDALNMAIKAAKEGRIWL